MEPLEFNKLSKLCRLSFKEEEKEDLIASLNNILTYISQLQEVDTQGVEPCFTVLEGTKTPLREDVPGETLNKDLFLENAQNFIGGLVKVPRIINKD